MLSWIHNLRVDMTKLRVCCIIFFALVFSVLPFFVKFFWFNVAPDDYFVDFKSYSAQDVPLGQNYSVVILDRDARNSYLAISTKELVLMKDGRQIHTMTTSGNNTLAFEKGSREIEFRYKLPEGLDSGQYQWYTTYDINVGYLEKRTVTIQTNEFRIER